MSEFQVLGPDLKKQIKLAARMPMNFAFSAGKKPDESFLAMHKKKPVGMLFKIAKKEGPTPRVASGVFNLDGNVLTLTCETDAPGLAKKLRQFFKHNRVSLNIVVLDASGNLLAEDGEESTGDAPETANAAPAEEPSNEAPAEEAIKDAPADAAEDPIAEIAGPDLAALTAELRALTLELKEMLPNLPPDQSEPLRAAAKACGEAIKAEDGAAAEQALASLRDGLANATPVEDPRVAPLRASFETHMAAARAAVDPAGAQKIDELAKHFEAALAAKDFAKAEKIVTMLKRLGGASDAPKGEAPSDGPEVAPEDAPLPIPGDAENITTLQGLTKLSDKDIATLEAWLKENAMAEEGLFDEVGGDRLAAALRGESRFGKLTNEQAYYLAGRATHQWVFAPRTGEDGSDENMREFVEGVRDDENAAYWASRAMLDSFVLTSQQTIDETGLWPEGPDISTKIEERELYFQTAQYAVDLNPEMIVPKLSELMGASEFSKWVSGKFERTIASGTSYDRNNEDLFEKYFDAWPQALQTKVASVLSGGHMEDDDVQTFVEGAYANADQKDVATPEAQAMWAGLLTDMVLADKAFTGENQKALRAELTRIMKTEAGRKLLFAEDANDPKKQATEPLRRWALEQIADRVADPKKPVWTDKELEKGWESPALAEAFAAGALKDAERRFAQPASFDVNGSTGKSVNVIGELMGIPPNNLPKEGEKAGAITDPLYKLDARPMGDILRHLKEAQGSGGEVQVTPIPITFTSNETGPALFKILRVEASPAVFFLDHGGGRYTDPEHWWGKCDMPAGTVSYPAGFELGAKLVTRETYASTPAGQAVAVMDTTVMVAGMAAAGVLIVATEGLATPFVVGTATAISAGSTVYGGVRAGQKLYDQHDKGHEISDLSDPTVRGLWLELGSSAVGFGAMKGGARAASLLDEGAQMSRTGANIVAGLSVTSNVVDAVAMADSVNTLSQNWDKMKEADKAKALLNLSVQVGMTAAASRKGGEKYLHGFDFKRVRNQLEHGSPYPLTKVKEGDKDFALLKDGEEFAVLWDPMPPDDIPGNFRIVYRGEQSPSKEMIALHSHAAQTMEASVSLETKLKDWLSGDVYKPEPGSPAWEAKIEIGKIREEAKILDAKRRSGELTDDQIAEIENRLLELDIAIVRETGRLSDWDKTNAHRAVASPARGARLARDKGWPEKPSDDMFWIADNDMVYARGEGTERHFYIESEGRLIPESQLTEVQAAEVMGLPVQKAGGLDPLPNPERLGTPEAEAALTALEDRGITGASEVDALKMNDYRQDALLSDSEYELLLDEWRDSGGLSVEEVINWHKLVHLGPDGQPGTIADVPAVARLSRRVLLPEGPVQAIDADGAHIDAPNQTGRKATEADETIMSPLTKAFLAKHSGGSIEHDIAGTGGIEQIEAGPMDNGEPGSFFVAITGSLLPGRLKRGSGDLKDGQNRAPNFNGSSKLIPAKELNFANPADWQRCHLWGPGFGDEAMAGMFFGPTVLNQKLQNRQIEDLLRTIGAQVAHPDVRAAGYRLKVKATAETWGTPKPGEFALSNGEALLRAVKYEFELTIPGGETLSARYEIRLETTPTEINNGVTPSFAPNKGPEPLAQLSDLLQALPFAKGATSAEAMTLWENLQARGMTHVTGPEAMAIETRRIGHRLTDNEFEMVLQDWDAHPEWSTQDLIDHMDTYRYLDPGY